MSVLGGSMVGVSTQQVTTSNCGRGIQVILEKCSLNLCNNNKIIIIIIYVARLGFEQRPVDPNLSLNHSAYNAMLTVQATQVIHKNQWTFGAKRGIPDSFCFRLV